MILGVNMAVGSATAAFWIASMDCAIKAADGICTQGAVGVFIEKMSSGDGLIFWAVIIAGLLVFWRGRRMRASA